MNEKVAIIFYIGILLGVLIIIRKSRTKNQKKEIESLEKECRLEIKRGLEEKYGEAFAEGFDKFYMEKIFIDLFNKKINRQEKILTDLPFQLKEYDFSEIKFDIKEAIDYAINFAEFTAKNNKRLINLLSEIK